MKNFKDFIAGDELVLVDFYAVWCGPCKTMHDILEEYKTMVKGTPVRILKLDIDSPANAAKIQEFRIGSVPTLMFFRGGEVLWRASGVTSAAKLKDLSDKFLLA
jgi:thioredoxin 1